MGGGPLVRREVGSWKGGRTTAGREVGPRVGRHCAFKGLAGGGDTAGIHPARGSRGCQHQPTAATHCPLPESLHK